MSDIKQDGEETDTFLMAVEDTWLDNGMVHIELFAPKNRFEDTGLPAESAVLQVFDDEPRDWSAMSESDESTPD